MTDTNQLPEPELGYIQTDKSNQPAFSARQMREAQQPDTGEPVAALVRSRRVRTPADCAFDKKDHYSEWSDWEPCTLSYARAVTDPARDKGLLPLYEMLPLYTHPAPSVPDDVVRGAKRYEWLRQHQLLAKINYMPTPSGEDLDAAIDAAMLAAKDSK